MTQLQDLKVPAEFSDLEDLVDEWSLPNERARKEKRATASMLGLTQFYDRLQSRIPKIAAHLDTVPYEVDSLSAANRNLVQLAYMYMETAMAVEFFRRPEQLAAFPRDRFIIEDIRI